MKERGSRTRVASILPAGTLAPEFVLRASPRRVVHLSRLRGRPVVLVFYPADWSSVCGDQLALYNEVLPEIHEYGAELVGISVDSVWSHAAYTEARKLRFPLLADFQPKGAVARQYGVYRRRDGHSERALFVIDGAGVICWSQLAPLDAKPGADGMLQALESIAAPWRSNSHSDWLPMIDPSVGAPRP